MSSNEGKIDEVTGRAKEAVGAITDDDALRREGRADQASGKAKGKLAELVDKARDAVKSALHHDDEDESGSSKGEGSRSHSQGGQGQGGSRG